MRIALGVLLLSLCAASSASAQIAKEKIELCTGAAVCVAENPVQWSLGTRAEFALDDVTGCTNGATATYALFGTNTGGTIAHLITTVSNATVSSQALEPAVWFPIFTVVPSTTPDGSVGCTSLQISIWITRPKL